MRLSNRLKYLSILLVTFQACSDDVPRRVRDIKPADTTVTIELTPPPYDSLHSPPPPPPNPPKPPSDSVEQIAFWNSVVIPLLKKDTRQIRATVTGNVEGDWPYMINMKKDIFSLNAQDFLNNYKLLITKDFISELAAQSYKDVDAYPGDDTVYCSFSVARKLDADFEGSVRFNYIKVKNRYKLVSVNGTGGNFYECEEDEDE